MFWPRFECMDLEGIIYLYFDTLWRNNVWPRNSVVHYFFDFIINFLQWNFLNSNFFCTTIFSIINFNFYVKIQKNVQVIKINVSIYAISNLKTRFSVLFSRLIIALKIKPFCSSHNKLILSTTTRTWHDYT